MKKTLLITALALAGVFAAIGPVSAQVAGATTTTGVSVIESTQVAMGWSVKKSLLGKTIYNESGKKVGKVEDIIISPDKSVSYVIVGAGGFIGMGRHDVAVPVSQIQSQAGKLVMPGATQDMIKSMAKFDYASDDSRRDHFIVRAEQDIAKGQALLADMQTKAGAATADVKAKMDLEITTLQLEVTSAQTKLTELKQAASSRWMMYEAGVIAATAKVRQSVKAAKN